MISPIDGRYKTDINKFLDENVLIGYCMEVENAILQSHLERTGKDLIEFELPTIMDIMKEEQKTHHQIKAIVNCIKSKIPEEHQHLVHLGVTSSDVYDTAFSLMIKNVMENHVIPEMGTIIHKLTSMIKEHSGTLQIGRTHGQFAIPMTFGHTLSSYRSRLLKSFIEMAKMKSKIGGKISGAVGNYAGMSLITDAKQFEKLVLGKLGLRKEMCFSQIAEPEYMLRLLLEMNIFFGIIANMADDFRNLQRSEIDEVRETFGENQVGSSTMPHKKNPWNSEHIKSMWKALSPRIMTFYMDQISDHQRDLTGSASNRFIPEYIAGFYEAITRMQKVLGGLWINKKQMIENIGASCWISEPIYILLAEQGIDDAHKVCMKVASKVKDSRGFLKKFRIEYPNYWDLIVDNIPTKRQYGVNPADV